MRRSAVPLTLGLLACCVAMMSAREAWSVAQSGSIRVLGDSSADVVSQMLAEVEQTRAMLARAAGVDLLSLPLHVFSLRDAKSLSETVPQQVRRNDLHTFGFSLTGAHDSFIALRTDRREESVRETLRHEYVHVLSALHLPGAPAWLDEGLSEFWRTIAVDGDHLVVGRAIPDHVDYLQRHKWLPIQDVLKQPRGSLPADPERVRSFYAQSWIMVHYLLVGAHKDEALEFAPSTRQIPDHFEVLLHQYASSDRLREVTVGWKQTVSSPPRITTVTTARALAERANLLVSSRQPQDGLAMARRALKVDAQDPLALAVIGIYYFRSNQPGEARNWLTRALDAGTDNFSAALYMSLLATSPADQQRYLVSALRARPDSELAWQRLGALWCRSLSSHWLWFGGITPCA